MHVRCCKSYAQAKEDNTPKVSVTKAPLYALPPQPYYQSQNPTYYQQPQQNYYQQPQSLLEENYETQASTYAQQPTYTQEQQPYAQQPVYQPTYASPTYDTYTPEVYEYVHTVASNMDQGTIVEHTKNNSVGIENEDLVSKFDEWAQALIENKEKAENVTENAEEYLTVLRKLYYQKQADVKNYSHTFELPTVVSHKGYYVGNDDYSKNTCEQLNIDIDFGTVIPLVVGHCYPQSCLLSQYVSCVENPVDDYKRFRPATPTYYPQQANNYVQAAPTYRSLLSVNGGSMMSLATIGFVAGVIVVALIQFVSLARSENQAIM